MAHLDSKDDVLHLDTTSEVSLTFSCDGCDVNRLQIQVWMHEVHKGPPSA